MPASRVPFDQGRMGLLEKIGRLLKGAKDYESAVRLGIQSALPELADVVAILTTSETGEERLRVAHVDHSRDGLTTELLEKHIPTFRKIAEYDVARGREFRWIPNVSETSLRFLRREPEIARLLLELQIRSLIVVPLRSGRRIFGALAVGRVRDVPFHAADLAVTQVLARRVGAVLENVQLYERAQDEQSRSDRLEAAVQKWAQVFDLAGWGAAIVDGADFRIEAVNPAFARLHGFGESLSLNGHLYSDLLASGREAEPLEWFTDQRRPYETLHLKADGSVFPVLTDVTALETDGSLSYVVTVQDVTELKRAEERLRKAQRLEAVGRLAGGVAHEVNNMMTIILGFSDLLSRSGALPPERQRDVEEIRKAATRAGKTTQQLLAFSRQQILQPSDLEINDVVQDLLPTLRLLLPANVVIDTALAPFGGMVHADRAQLDQVLINLAFNARDAMPGGGTLRLTTESRWLDEETGRRLIGVPITAGQYATISVIDTGHGMDAATMTQVFDPFFTTKPVGSGTGLGLATAYGIVKQSGGYIWVESTPQQGTTVTVCLPQLQRPLEPWREAEEQQPVETRCRRGTVLVVEDEDGVRDLARRVLEQQGHRILQAENGVTALQMLERHGPSLDLVLSDVIVPEIGTKELEREVHQRRPELPILYMSGYSRQEMVERGLVPPGGAFLQKPFTAEELGELVCRQLEPDRARGNLVNTGVNSA